MPAPYHAHLRQAAVDAVVNRKVPKVKVAKMFNISRNTLDLWLKRYEETGSIEPTRHRSKGPQPKITDLKAFEEFANTHGHLSLKQMASQWGNVSHSTIARALKQIGFTRKKELWPARLGQRA